MFGGGIRTYTLPCHLGPPGAVLTSPSALTNGRMELTWGAPIYPADSAAAVSAAPAEKWMPIALNFSVDPSEAGATVGGRLYRDGEIFTFVGGSASGAVALGAGATRTHTGPFEGLGPIRTGCYFSVFVSDINGGFHHCVGDLDQDGNVTISPLAGDAFADEAEAYYILPFIMSWIAGPRPRAE